MSLPFIFQNGGDFEFKSGVPPQYNGPILAHAIVKYSESSKASIISQTFLDTVFSFQLTIAQFFQKLKCTAKLEAPGLYFRFQLKNHQRINLGTSQRLVIREDQFSGIFAGCFSCDYNFNSPEEYRYLEIYFSPELLKEHTEYPELNDVLQKRESIIFHDKPLEIQIEMYEVIHKLLNPNLALRALHKYYRRKIELLLILILDYKFNRPHRKIKLNKFEIGRLNNAKEILLTEYISQKPPELQELALRAKLSLKKLKEGFKQEFGVSPIEFLMDEKMKKARHLILTTDYSQKWIAKQIGYPRLSNFLTAFKRRFGYTAGALRK